MKKQWNTKRLLSALLLVGVICFMTLVQSAFAHEGEEHKGAKKMDMPAGPHEMPAETHDMESLAADDDEPKGISRVVRFAGEFHPVVVHFPVGLIIAAALAEILFLRRRQPSYSEAAFYCLVLGAFFAVLAAALGWADGAFAGFSGARIQVLSYHRWIGTITAIVTLIACILAWRAREKVNLRIIYRVFLFSSAMLVSVAGHLGAMLTHGLDYFKF